MLDKIKKIVKFDENKSASVTVFELTDSAQIDVYRKVRYTIDIRTLKVSKMTDKYTRIRVYRDHSHITFGHYFDDFDYYFNDKEALNEFIKSVTLSKDEIEGRLRQIAQRKLKKLFNKSCTECLELPKQTKNWR